MSAPDLASSDEWATPPELFGALAGLYGPFELDAAANQLNHKAPFWFGFGGLAPDATAEECTGFAKPLRVWMNPPYSRGNLERFMAWARARVLDGRFELVTCLVPGHTAEGWWHRHVEAPAGELCQVSTETRHTAIGPATRVRWQHLTVETLRVRGRVHFVEASGATGAARFPSVAVTFARPGVLEPLAKKRGPAPIVTAELEAAMRRFIDEGNTIGEACRRTGIARKTWYRHLERSHTP